MNNKQQPLARIKEVRDMAKTETQSFYTVVHYKGVKRVFIGLGHIRLSRQYVASLNKNSSINC